MNNPTLKHPRGVYTDHVKAVALMSAEARWSRYAGKDVRIVEQPFTEGFDYRVMAADLEVLVKVVIPKFIAQLEQALQKIPMTWSRSSTDGVRIVALDVPTLTMTMRAFASANNVGVTDIYGNAEICHSSFRVLVQGSKATWPLPRGRWLAPVGRTYEILQYLASRATPARQCDIVTAIGVRQTLASRYMKRLVRDQLVVEVEPRRFICSPRIIKEILTMTSNTGRVHDLAG